MNTNSQATGNLFENDSTQMAFSVTGSRKLGLSVDKPVDEVCDFLAHHIARKPLDLLVHVQRIKLASDNDLKPVLHGALLDLYIALGRRGYELRKCMLDLVSKNLEITPARYFANGLKKGIKASDPVRYSGVSVLCKNITGSIELIDTAHALDDRYIDPLEQALASIECSQLEEAREILEKSIHAGTSNLEQQTLLLSLYRKTDNKTRFTAFYSTLAEGMMADRQAWLDTASRFGIED